MAEAAPPTEVEIGSLTRPSAPGPSAHFCYASVAEYLSNELAQGDVLRRTDALDSILESVHPHFFRHNKNLFFMVLTQSCDLAIRGGDGAAAPYISIAPVRPVDEAISREIAGLQIPGIRGEVPLLTNKSRTKLVEFSRRLIDNNVSQYFFLESSGTDLGQDCCAFLRLSIAIKTDLHYQACVDAKILQLNDSFQAKLGSLVGQLYARVGTKEWERSSMQAKVDQFTKDAAHYVDDEKVKALRGKFDELTAANSAHVMSVEEITGAIKQAPSRKKMILSRTLEVASELLKLDEKQRQKLQGRLQADQALNQALGS
jgi:hypothetical protein